MKIAKVGTSVGWLGKYSLLLAISVMLIGVSLSSPQIAEAGTCVKTVRYCAETLPDGKCKLWDNKEIEITCGDKNTCAKEERYCEEKLSDGKCKLWGSRTVTYPC